ncbi:MAG: 50S ribosomal protein L30 [Thermodesulfobacteriota bacterium]
MVKRSTIKIKLIKSAIGYSRNQKDTLRGLGLTRMNKVVLLKDTPAIWGMVRKVQHLVSVEKD